MCNLYRMTKGVAEIAHIFDVLPDPGANYAEEVYPGYTGLVVADGRARAMTWGFPLALKGRQGQTLKPKPVTNARDDKLLAGFWLPSFKSRRCLIPVSAWAEPEGRRGAMTRTWYTLDGSESFAVAGLWRSTPEWGDTYSMVMTDACTQMVDVHDRMPVILAQEDWDRWSEGSADDALRLCQTSDGILNVDRTDERWVGEAKPSPSRRLPEDQPRLL